jgi:hypothetical protein
MDRRDALKKLGMGGATVVGATMVVSSPAFAFADPTVDNEGTVQAIISVLDSWGRVVRLQVNGAIVGCPNSASGGAVGGPSFSSSLVETTSIGLRARIGSPDPYSNLPTTIDSDIFRIRTFDAGTPIAGAVVENTVTVTYTCTYDNAPPADPEVRSTSYTQTITLNL